MPEPRDETSGLCRDVSAGVTDDVAAIVRANLSVADLRRIEVALRHQADLVRDRWLAKVAEMRSGGATVAEVATQAGLTADHLYKLGSEWEARTGERYRRPRPTWDEQLIKIRSWAEAHPGELPSTQVGASTIDGYDVGVRVRDLRLRWREGKLAQEHFVDLDNILGPGWHVLRRYTRRRPPRSE